MTRQRFAISCFLFLSIIQTSAQTLASSFLGEDFVLYNGAYLKVDTSAPALAFYESFFLSLDDIKNSDFQKDVLYACKFEQKGGSNWWRHTFKDSIANKTYLVEDIIDKNGLPFNHTSFLEKIIFKLTDSTTRQTIYFRYNKVHNYMFPFTSSGITFNKDYFCAKLERIVDDFTGETRINSPVITNRKISPVTISKIIDKDKVKTAYFLTLSTNGTTPVVDGTGATILFTDGTKLTKPTKINVSVYGSSYAYNSTFQLTSADISLLATKEIKKFRLYIFDEEPKDNFGSKFILYTNCIKTAK